jgi:hypothetical protein
MARTSTPSAAPAATALATAAPADTAEQKAKPAEKETTVTIYPLRTYQDAGEIRRKGGAGYPVTKAQAQQLVARGLASETAPKAKAEGK